MEPELTEGWEAREPGPRGEEVEIEEEKELPGPGRLAGGGDCGVGTSTGLASAVILS